MLHKSLVLYGKSVELLSEEASGFGGKKKIDEPLGWKNIQQMKMRYYTKQGI